MTTTSDKKSLEFRGWETKDTYSNNVSFIIDNLKINNQIVDAKTIAILLRTNQVMA